MKKPPHLIEPAAVHTAILSGYHTLIAGKTGSGKSVVIDGLICTILSEFTPREVIMLIGDPKRVDFHKYRKAGHVKIYADTVPDIEKMLDTAIELMNTRYKIMKVKKINKWDGRRVVIIIDEIADLMLSDRKKAITQKLVKLLQLARAAKITVIMATQVIRSYILTAPIVANMQPLGLQTRNALESRMIIQESGCENLPKYGECLYATVDGLEKFKVPLIPDTTINELIKYW